MRFTYGTAGLATILAFSSLVVALPKLAGNGDGATNVCDQRGPIPEFKYGRLELRPNLDDCQHLVDLFRSGSIFGDQTTINKKERTFTSGDCRISVWGKPVFEDDGPWKVGKEDLADLVSSAMTDFRNDEQATIMSGGKKFAVRERDVVSCESEKTGQLILVKYEVGKVRHGHTLPSNDDKPKKEHKKKGKDDDEKDDDN